MVLFVADENGIEPQLGIEIADEYPVPMFLPGDDKGYDTRFCEGESTFIQPRNFNRWFYDFCVDHGFGRYTRNVRAIKRGGKTLYRGEGYEGIVPHSLRHTQSTLLIGSGVDVKTVQARLGHSSPNLTLKQYTRVLSNNDQLAASQFDRLLASQDDLTR